jgi:HEAT repeat protein
MVRTEKVPNFTQLALALGLGLILTHAVLAADPLMDNPVRDLRRVLKVPVVDTLPGSTDLELREREVRQCVGSLTRIADLRDALLLQDWRCEDSEENIAVIDQAARLEIARRFERSMFQLLQCKDPVIQIAAANLLEEITPAFGKVRIAGWSLRNFSVPLLDLVHCSNPRLQEAAARALCQIQPSPQDAAEAFGYLQQSPDKALRRLAVECLNRWLIAGEVLLGRSNGKQMVTVRPELLQMCRAVIPAASIGSNDSDASVRRLSIETIQHLALLLQKLVADPRRVVARALQDLEPYRQEVESEYAELLPLLRELEERSFGLTAALTDPEPIVRLQAHQTIQEIGYIWKRLEARAASLPSPLPSGDVQLRREGKNGLVVTPTIRGKEIHQSPLTTHHHSLPGLAAGLTDPDPRVRRTAVEVLENLATGAEPARPALTKALEDPDLFVRWAAARTLGKMGPVRGDGTVPALAKLLRDPDLDVQLAAAEALRRYGPAASEAVPSLIAIVRWGDSAVRLAALIALEGIGTAAQPAIPAVIRALQAPESRIRKSAALLLAKFGPVAGKARAALQRAMQDTDPEVRQAAADALLAIGPTVEQSQPVLPEKNSSHPITASGSAGIWRTAPPPATVRQIIPASFVPPAEQPSPQTAPAGSDQGITDSVNNRSLGTWKAAAPVSTPSSPTWSPSSSIPSTLPVTLHRPIAVPPGVHFAQAP